MSQVNPEEVRNFLEEEVPNPATETTQAPQMPGHEVVKLDDVVAAQEAENKKTADMLKRVEEDRNKNFEPDRASLAHLSAWALNENNIKVEVSEQDKALYFKSLLSDSPLILNISLEVGVTFTIRALTNYEMEIVFLTLESMSKKSQIVGPAQYASLVQQCAAALQIVSYGGKPLEPPYFNPQEHKSAEAIAILEERISKVIGPWAGPRWQLAVTALRIFEAKVALCNENARVANFWQTADAS